MNLLYNGVVGYERIRNFWGAIIMSIIGLLFVIVGIYTFFNPPQPIPNNTPSATKDPPAVDPAYTWAVMSGIGLIFIIIAGMMLYLATDQSETTKNILAVQGTYNAFNSIFGNRNGGNFDIGE